MTKKPRVRTLMDSQNVKGLQRLLKSVLVVSEIFRLFVNILAPTDKYSLSVKVTV